MSLAFVSKLLILHVELRLVKKSCLFTFDTFKENSWQISESILLQQPTRTHSHSAGLFLFSHESQYHAVLYNTQTNTYRFVLLS